MDLQEQLLKTIELLIDAKTQQIPYNTCIEGIITSDTPIEDGSYPFEYQGQTFYAFPLSNTQVIKKNDWVYVLIIGNDFSGKKIILTNKTKEDTQPKIYNEIAKLQTGINYLKNINLNEWYTLTCNTIIEQAIDLEYDENLLKVAASTEYMKLSFEIESNLEQITNADYGLRIELKYDDNSVETYSLNLNKITGNPYQALGKKYYIQQLPLTKVPIKVNKIQLYLKGFNVNLNKYVKFKNPRIEFVDDSYVDIIRELPYTIIIESTNGSVFKDGVGTTTLKAKIFYGGVEVTNNIDNNKIQWRRVSKNAESDAVWNTGKFGKEITINATDFSDEATFYCELLE